jgi:hypothetical protein
MRLVQVLYSSRAIIELRSSGRQSDSRVSIITGASFLSLALGRAEITAIKLPSLPHFAQIRAARCAFSLLSSLRRNP